MGFRKTPDEVAIMTECGSRLRAAYETLLPTIRSGETTAQIDARADQLLTDNGLGASFKTVQGYRWATCLAVNDQAVHTPPGSTVLAPGDVLTVDYGGLYRGYHTDWATTIIVDGVADPKKVRFLDAGKRALELTLSHLKVGEHIGLVGKIMQETIEGAGYRVMRELTGHGIGRELHEDPHIPNVMVHPVSRTARIESGFVAAIEIIYSESSEKFVQKSADRWSLDTTDGSLAACFEHTVHIDSNGVHILT